MIVQKISYNYYNATPPCQNKKNSIAFGKLSDMPYAGVTADRFLLLAKELQIPEAKIPKFLRGVAKILDQNGTISIGDVATCLKVKAGGLAGKAKKGQKDLGV